MSVLAVEILPNGMLFGADRNITVRETIPNTPDSVGLRMAQTQRRKVLRWPRRQALVGYVGAARINGTYTDEWLFEFIGRNPNVSSLGDLAEKIRGEVEVEQKGKSTDDDLLIIHLGGFEKRDGHWVPVVYWVRNYTGRDKSTGHYTGVTDKFVCEDAFWTNPDVMKAKMAPKNARALITVAANNDAPFWIHQGTDLLITNIIDRATGEALKALYKVRPVFAPKTMQDWERNLQMRILAVVAFYDAFKNPGEKLIGGGADVESIIWPAN